jgi:hypothetical protein
MNTCIPALTQKLLMFITIDLSTLTCIHKLFLNYLMWSFRPRDLFRNSFARRRREEEGELPLLEHSTVVTPEERTLGL